ncbi:MAG: hypothetical protein LBH18_06900 [Spirochaetaceae bacterium]|jgi:hypothetical protein|nr:hypothetical protein [Spirochaetaceae bacterium]
MKKTIFFGVLLLTFLSFYACIIEIDEISDNGSNEGLVFANAELDAVGTEVGSFAQPDGYKVKFSLDGGGRPPEISGCYVDITELLVDDVPQSNKRSASVTFSSNGECSLALPTKSLVEGWGTAGTIQIDVRGAYLDYTSDVPVDPVYTSRKKSIMITSAHLADIQSSLSELGSLAAALNGGLSGTINAGTVLDLAVAGSVGTLVSSYLQGGSVVLPPGVTLEGKGTAASLAGTDASFSGPAGSLILFGMDGSGGTLAIMDTGSGSTNSGGVGTMVATFSGIGKNKLTLKKTINTSGASHLLYDMPPFGVLINVYRVP